MSTTPASARSGPPVTGISSMATRQVLAELATAYQQRCGQAVSFESVGGVDAARRVQAGEAFDVVLLAADAIARLMAAGHLQAGSRVDVVTSPVAVAVRAGAARPDISTEDALRAAVLAASSISFSTGPSGVYLTQLFERWGITEQVQARMVQAPPGVPVGSLVASGQVALGFQQLSEMINLPGLDVLGVLPPGAAFITTFSAALGQGLVAGSAQHQAALAWLHYLTSPEAADTKRRHGMQPA